MCELNCFRGISKLNRCEIIALTNSVAVLLSDGLDSEDADMLGNIVSTIGSLISTFAAVEDSNQRDEGDDS